MNQRMINLAKKEALKSTFRLRLGAVLHNGSRVLAVGFNKVDKTHPMAQVGDFNIKRHAEMDALIRARHHDLHGCDITIARIKKDGSLGLSRPCKHCFKELKTRGVRKIHYSNEYGNFTTVRVISL